MNYVDVNKADIPYYKNLVVLARAQLNFIQKRLSGVDGKWERWGFKFRNLKIKRTILKILKRKDARVGDRALDEMMDDYRRIESTWTSVKKDDLDYIRMIVHGLKDVTDRNDQVI